MCTRYVLHERHLREVLARLGIATPAKFESRYNIAPGKDIPVVRTRGGRAEMAGLRWGLVPSWAGTDQGTTLVNARAETVTEKPSFRDAFRLRRCLIPASGFYEWETRGKAKLPWLFRRRDETPFAFAGLWDAWQAPTGGEVQSCAFITTTPNELMRPIHHRMPVMLGPEEFAGWLDPQVTEPEKVAAFLRVPEAAGMTALAVSTYMSNVRHEGPECLTPASEVPPVVEPQLGFGF